MKYHGTIETVAANGQNALRHHERVSDILVIAAASLDCRHGLLCACGVRIVCAPIIFYAIMA